MKTRRHPDSTPPIALRAIGVGLALAAVIALMGLAISSAGDLDGILKPQSAPSSTAPSPPGSLSGPGVGATVAPLPAQSPGTTQPPGTTAPRQDGATEQLGAVAGAALPSPSQLPALITLPLPKPASAVGKLVAGFPAAIPVVKGSTILDSSLSSIGDVLQATLVAKTSLSPAAVLSTYQSEFARMGLQASPLPTVGGSTAFGFTRESNSVTLTVTPTGGGTKYTLLGVLRPSA
jgi:hypothetical protein